MAEYQSLKVLYHMDPAKAQRTYFNRFSDEDAIHFPSGKDGYPFFAVYSKKMGMTIAEIYQYNHKLASLAAKMPNLSLLLQNSLLDEIQMTNEIEGIHSSRQMLNQVWNQEEKEIHNLKFRGLVRQYKLLLEETKITRLETPTDIREQYNLLLWDDIASEDVSNLPDGSIFRKNSVAVYSGSQKIIHKGLIPEEAIISELEKALQFLRTADEDPLIKIAYFHFLFGYIHPFYDGNGRLNRYLSTLLLKDHLELMGIFQLSYMIRNHRKAYYELFQLSEHPLNMGELTQFIQYFLDQVKESMMKALDLVQEKQKQIDDAYHWIEQWPKAKERPLLKILADYSILSYKGVFLSELVEKTGQSERTLRTFLNSHADLVFKERDGHSIRYSLHREAYKTEKSPF